MKFTNYMMLAAATMLLFPCITALSFSVSACRAINSAAWAESNPGTAEARPAAKQEVLSSPTGSLQPLNPQLPALPSAEIRSTPSTTPAEQGLVDLLHRELSHNILSTAVWLDSYFGDERAVLEQNRSYFRIRYDVFQEERASLLVQPSFDMRFVLPQLEKKAHIVLSAEPNEPQKGTSSPLATTGEPIATTDERNLTAAFHYLYRTTPGESFIVRTGAQFSNGKPVLFAAPRYRSLKSLDGWDFRFTQDAVYKTSTQWQAETTFDLERSLPHDLFFRSSLDGNWYANTVGYFCSLGFSLRQVFTPTQALDYEWVNSYQTRPVYELAEIAFRVRYRHSFWREWLFFEVAPQIRFPRGGNFDVLPGILFRFETFFGRIAG